MSILQPWAFYIIFLIFSFSLSIENTPMTWIWFIFKYDIYLLVHVCLSTSAQLCCKIKLVSFWVHLNVRPTCVIVANFSWSSVSQYSTNNHSPGSIVVNINLPNPNIFGPVTESCRYMLLSLLPSEWTWHCVISCDHIPFSQLFFRMKSFMSIQWYFRINNW